MITFLLAVLVVGVLTMITANYALSEHAKDGTGSLAIALGIALGFALGWLLGGGLAS